jgi:hypothetical protein
VNVELALAGRDAAELLRLADWLGGARVDRLGPPSDHGTFHDETTFSREVVPYLSPDAMM